MYGLNMTTLRIGTVVELILKSGEKIRGVIVKFPPNIDWWCVVKNYKNGYNYLANLKSIECLNVRNFFLKYFKKKLRDKEEGRVLHHIAICSECMKKWVDFYHTKMSKKSSLTKIKNFFKIVK